VTQSVVDPYGGYREHWTVALLDAASQGAGVVFDTPAVRQMPAANQILLDDRAHFEACGPTCLAAGAYAVGHIESGAVTSTAIDACRFLGDDAVAAGGTSTSQLLSYARHRGWPVHEDDRKAGTLALALLQTGQVGVSALDTAYGSGASWNVLHPQAGGSIGHWEGFGAVDGPGGSDMDPNIEETLRQFAAWETFVTALGRLADPGGFSWLLGEIRAKGYAPSLWDVLAGKEYKGSGGLLGRLDRQQAQIDALTKQLATDEQAAKIAAAAEDALQKHVDDLSAAVASLRSSGTGGATVPTSSTTTVPQPPRA
jgi:hypothetical protein